MAACFFPYKLIEPFLVKHGQKGDDVDLFRRSLPRGGYIGFHKYGMINVTLDYFLTNIEPRGFIMGVVYRNLKDMPMPSFAFPNRHDGSVYIVTVDEEGVKHRKTIGALTTDTSGQERMVPNAYFREVYPDLWKENDPDLWKESNPDLWQEKYPDGKIPGQSMGIGLYILTLRIFEKNQLGQILQEVYGPEIASHILEYAIVSVLQTSATARLLEVAMAGQAPFSETRSSSPWDLLCFFGRLSEQQHHLLRIKWIQSLVKNGLKRVWLSIGGRDGDLKKSRNVFTGDRPPLSPEKRKTVPAYVYALDADSGRPVTYLTCEGAASEGQALQEIAAFLKEFEIGIEGVVLGPGFAAPEVFKAIEGLKWKYVIQLPWDTPGHVEMRQEFGEVIRWNPQYILEDEALFGISAKRKLFPTRERPSNICLYFDGSAGALQSIQLSNQIQHARKEVEAAIASGSEACVPPELQSYLSIEGEGAERKLVERFEEWDKALSENGFFSLATWEESLPGEAYRVDQMREATETLECILKAQEGGPAFEMQGSGGSCSAPALLFLSSILRFEIEGTCKTLGLDTDATIQELNGLILTYTGGNKEVSVKNLTSEIKELFSQYSLSPKDFECLALDLCRRPFEAFPGPARKMETERPVVLENTHKRGRRKNSGGTARVDRREQGTSEKQEGQEEQEKQEQEPEKIRSKGGRPKGRKDAVPRKPRSDKGMKRGSRKPE